MKTPLILPLLAAACLALPRAGAQDLLITVVSKGVEIQAGGLGQFVLEPPNALLENGKTEKPQFEKISETEGKATYLSGGEVLLQVSGNEILATFNSPPPASGLMFQMLIPIKFKDGGKFAFGSGEPKEFPAQHAGQFAGTASGREIFSLTNALGDGFSIEAQANWQAVQDNRKFGWEIFAYQFLLDLKAVAGKNSLIITVTPIGAR